VSAFRDQLVTDVGSAMSAALVVLGDQLGLWTALAEQPVTAAELAAKTETSERYIREWLNAMAASSYVTYEAGAQMYRLEPERAAALAELAGMFQITAAMWAAEPKIAANFRTGAGLAWDRQHSALFAGAERWAHHAAAHVPSWLAALDGMVGKLEDGARVADVGCGAGAATIAMAKAFPRSTVVGFDTHAASIDLARRRAREAGVDVQFEVASATELPGHGYDLISCFDSFHDLEDPGGAAARARAAIAPDGAWLIVEPFAADRPEDNHNAIGRVYYSTSTMVSVPHSLARGGPALGAQAGEARLRQHVIAGGWTRFRRAAATQLHLVLEARP
jgi:2-polyprenyl-3-methyl-5-hydroxy-6-metoxy-1,4-benzoquinol methylase